MKRIYNVGVFFDYPFGLRGEVRTEKLIVEASSIAMATKLGAKVARRVQNGGYAPRIISVVEHGTVDAR